MKNDKQKNQKDIQETKEQFHFELFKKLCKQWRDDGLEDKNRNERIPDFLFRYPDNVLGIEHCELFKDKRTDHKVSPQQQEGSLQKIVDEARNICVKRGIPPLEVKLFFAPAFENKQITKNQGQQVSKRLAWFVENSSKTVSSLPPLIESGDKLPEIPYMSIEAGNDDHRWNKVPVCLPKEDFIIELQERINNKNEKYGGYIEKCDECWLFIVANRRNPAQAFDDSSGIVIGHTYQSKFSRTFYMEVTRKYLEELKTTR